MDLSDEDKKSVIMRIIQMIELADKSERFGTIIINLGDYVNVFG